MVPSLVSVIRDKLYKQGQQKKKKKKKKERKKKKSRLLLGREKYSIGLIL